MNILNDTEHRIFLSAMAKEKEICQKIDGDKIYDSVVKMLVPVCESIERKVDKAILIPDGATNGDVIKAMFGSPAREGKAGILYKFKYRNGKPMFSTYFDFDWWNTPYKEV